MLQYLGCGGVRLIRPDDAVDEAAASCRFGAELECVNWRLVDSWAGGPVVEVEAGWRGGGEGENTAAS